MTAIVTARSALLPAAFAGLLLARPASAQTEAERIRILEEQLKAQDARIAQLERLLTDRSEARASPAAAPTPPVAVAATPAVNAALPAPNAAPPSVLSLAPPLPANALTVSGDLRLREEFNWSDADARDRTRTVLRARLRGTYTIHPHILLGAEIATGDPDDPNTTDVTLGEFDDDLNISLDQIFVRGTFGHLNVWGGKFPLPFRRTDLVWDGDVGAQGVGAIYSLPVGKALIEAHGVYFIISESTVGRGSDMLGGQITASVPLGSAWQTELAGAWYDYRLHGLEGADAGDYRGNLRNPDGSYMSDFKLANILGTIRYNGLGPRWPISLTGEYVHNFGAATSGDSGYSFELTAGRAAARGDWRFSYGYMMAEVDAVFAAFSHDNLSLSTNYRQHSLSIDHMLLPSTMLNMTYYRYRPEDPVYSGLNNPHDWLSRMRLNILFSF
ncbi:MAG: hypothetical protein DI568_01240 [Sphingomonas sp.]|nr:MAG: hypothetical protein DI568_01240 [Sphingomonas sp.]